MAPSKKQWIYILKFKILCFNVLFVFHLAMENEPCVLSVQDDGWGKDFIL